MVPIQGKYAARCQPVIDAFQENFVRGGEVGAALCIFQQGEKCVDIWAGKRDRHGEKPWQADTLVDVFSAGKGVLAVCMLQLIAKGLLELDQPVKHYWPEFANRGKEAITVRMLMNHQSGLAAFSQPVADDDIFDWQKIVGILAEESPWWTPGTQSGYHPFTFGWLLGELLRRITGQSPGEYIRHHIANPLGAECYVGLKDEQLHKVADVAPLLDIDKSSNSKRKNRKKTLQSLSGIDNLTSRAFTYPSSLTCGSNATRWRKAQIPAANLHASASGLAKVYAGLAMGGCIENVKLLPSELLPLCYQVSSEGKDAVLQIPIRYSQGFMLPQADFGLGYGEGKRCFGHPGAGGSLGFADPDYRVGFAYVSNRLSSGVFGDRRVTRLVKAFYSVF